MNRILGFLLISLLTFSNSHADKLLEKNLIINYLEQIY